MIMKRFNYIFLALFIIALTACNTAVNRENTSETNTADGKAYLSVVVNPENGRAMALPQDMQEDDVVRIRFLANQRNGSFYIEKTWENIVQEDDDGEVTVITAFDQFREEAASIELIPDYYDFYLWLDIEPFFPEKIPEGIDPYDIGQLDKIENKEIVEGQNTVVFNTKYEDVGGVLLAEFTWNPLINQTLNNITEIDVTVMYTDSTTYEIYNYDQQESLTDIKTKYKNPYDKYPSNYLLFKKGLRQGEYYLKYEIYSTDPLNEKESIVYQMPPALIKIGNYKTCLDICLDSYEFNNYYTVNFLLDDGTWQYSEPTGITRNGYASYDFSYISGMKAPDYYSFKGWAECTSDGKLKSTSEDGEPMLVTKVEAGTQRNTWFKAIWEKNYHKITYELGLEDIELENKNPTTFWEGDTIELLPLEDTEDYIFDGWAPLVGNKITGWNPGEKTEDLDLYAAWKPVPKYKISFSAGDGKGDEVVYEGKKTGEKITGPEYTYSKHTFIGWEYTLDGKTTYIDSNEFTVGDSDVTLVARWQEHGKTPDVVFSTVPDSGEEDVEVDYNTQITLSCSGNGSGNAQIYYTTDETDPSESETRILYDSSKPIVITEDVTISVYAVNEVDDLFDSSVTTVIYRVKEVSGSNVSISFEPAAGVGIGSENELQLTISLDKNEKEYTITASSVEKQYETCLWFINGELVKDADGTTITSITLTQDYSEYEGNYTLYKIYCVATTAEGDSDDATYKLQVGEDW